MAFFTLRRGRRDQPTALQSSSNSYKSMSRSVLKKMRPLLLDDGREFRDTDSSLPPSYPSYSTWQEDGVEESETAKQVFPKTHAGVVKIIDFQ